MSSMNIAEEIMNLEPNVRSGTLRMFGCWFGRPMDNIHQVFSAELDQQLLKVFFSGGEILEVFQPSKLVVEGTTMKIPKASRVKWSWFNRGKPKIRNNLISLEYLVHGNTVSVKTIIALPEKASLKEAAVEIC